MSFHDEDQQPTMRRNWTILIACAPTIFGGSWMAADHVFRRTGPHTWGNAHLALRGLQVALADYHEETGDLPAIERIEEEVRDVWEYGAKGISKDHHWNYENFLTQADEERLRIWDRPPRVVRRHDVHAYGFYLEGEDGVSASQGEDPDDINSWDFTSVYYYYHRLRHRQWIRNGLWAAVPTCIFFVIGFANFIRPSLPGPRGGVS